MTAGVRRRPYATSATSTATSCGFEEAVDCEQQALALARDVGHRWGQGRALELLGLAVQPVQGLEAAQVCSQEALTIFRELDAPEADEVRALIEAAAAQDKASTSS